MRPRERREMEQAVKIAAGDRRAALLANTPPSERSEVAARYDHREEIVDLQSGREPTADELSALQMSLWRATVAVALAERGGYRDIVPRYMGGLRVSAGMARTIEQVEAETPTPDDADVRAAWSEGRRDRRQYLRSRYGI